MPSVPEAGPPVVVKAYGRGSLLGLLSVPIAYAMAAVGMRGWENAALRSMEDDAVAFARRGYRVRSTVVRGWPQLGIVTYTVTYERAEAPAST